MQLGMDYAARVEADPALSGALRGVVARHYYRDADPAWIESDVGKISLNYEGVWRYTNACRWVVPWALKHIDLRNCFVADIGAGTGATSAAFAHVAKSVIGYEIEDRSVAAAHERFDILGVKNATVKLAAPEQQLATVKADFANGAEAVLLFAVLEHLTQTERQLYLSTIWNEILVPGGHLIVVDTPNRLALFDSHTSELPFFHLLPPELALRYFSKSPRKSFVDGLQASIDNREDVVEALHRWGLGASYHDFEIAFERDLDGLLVASGFEWEMTNWFPPKIEDELMIRYFLERGVSRDLGFARSVLNLIFRKPVNGETSRPKVDRSHLELLVSYHNLDPRIVEHLS